MVPLPPLYISPEKHQSLVRLAEGSEPADYLQAAINVGRTLFDYASGPDELTALCIPAGNGSFDIIELEFAEREDALDDEMRQLHLEQSCVAQKLPLYEDDLEDVYATAERVGCSAMQFVDLSVEYFELIASTQEPAWLTNGHDNLILSNDIF